MTRTLLPSAARALLGAAAIQRLLKTVAITTRRLISEQNLELRVEVFNLFNNFNWGNPNTNLDAGTFGRTTSQSGDMRIVQFGLKSILWDF